MSNPAPGFIKHPAHEVLITPSTARVEVRSGNTLIAASSQALEVRESRYPPVFYVPLADVKQRYLQPSEHQTYCPFKGHAGYFHLQTDTGQIDNCIWTYAAPFDECLPLQDTVAFYADKVDISVIPEPS